MFTSIGSSAGTIRQGKIRAIATSGLKRATALPDVPTIAEQGHSGFQVNTWTAILVPAKTPEHVSARLDKELVQILRLRELEERLSMEGGEVSPMTLQEAAAFFRSEVALGKQRVKDANLPAE